MKYLAKEVRIYTDTNSRGEYHWMSMRLFNDANPKANPSRLPTYYVTLDTIVNAFLECKDALKQNEGGWIDVDMSKVPDEGLTQHHLDDIQPEEVILDGWYLPVYRRDYTDGQGHIHSKGSVRVASNGMPAPAVNSLQVFVQYYEGDFIENGQKVHRWIPVETANQIVFGANGVLARSYRKQTAQAAAPVAEEPEPEPEMSPEDKEAKRKELEARIAALG